MAKEERVCLIKKYQIKYDDYILRELGKSAFLFKDSLQVPQYLVK